MPKLIQLQHEGELTTLAYKRVDRKQLYGHRRRVPTDPNDEPCTRASLSNDGALLLRSGMTAQGYFDDAGTWVPQKALVAVDAEGAALDKVSSSLGEDRALEGPIDPRELLDVQVTGVYALDAESIGGALWDALLAGSIFRFEFTPRASWERGTAYLVANSEGELFALSGDACEPTWLELDAPPPVELDDDDDDDDLDFEMF